VTPFENIDKLIIEFEPYKELWLSSAEFLKLQSAVLQNPLANLEESSIESKFDELLNIISNCVEQLAEVPGIDYFQFFNFYA
jgi:dynein heavy chain